MDGEIIINGICNGLVVNYAYQITPDIYGNYIILIWIYVWSLERVFAYLFTDSLIDSLTQYQRFLLYRRPLIKC